jgi:hypothetical protein
LRVGGGTSGILSISVFVVVHERGVEIDIIIVLRNGGL